jgi:hypothetical protein
MIFFLLSWDFVFMNLVFPVRGNILLYPQYSHQHVVQHYSSDPTMTLPESSPRRCISVHLLPSASVNRAGTRGRIILLVISPNSYLFRARRLLLYHGAPPPGGPVPPTTKDRLVIGRALQRGSFRAWHPLVVVLVPRRKTRSAQPGFLALPPPCSCGADLAKSDGHIRGRRV